MKLFPRKRKSGTQPAGLATRTLAIGFFISLACIGAYLLCNLVLYTFSITPVHRHVPNSRPPHHADRAHKAVLFDDLDTEVAIDGALGEPIVCKDDAISNSSPNAFALEGTFYDLKMTRSGAPSEIAERVVDQDGRAILRLRAGHEHAGHEYGDVLSRFFENWCESELDNYYRAETKHYASYFYLPSVQSGYAPKAFGCDEVSQPGGWLCVYRGCVVAPKTGKFRFIGTGDDFLAVRFNKSTVLEAGYYLPSLWRKGNPAADATHGPESTTSGGWRKFWDDVNAGRHKNFAGYELIRNTPHIPRWNHELGGLTAGKAFEVEEGQVYPIEVAVGDRDGMMGFVLLIEEVTDNQPPQEMPDIFHTRFSVPDIGELRAQLQEYMDGPELQAPPYNEHSYIWMTRP